MGGRGVGVDQVHSSRPAHHFHHPQVFASGSTRCLLRLWVCGRLGVSWQDKRHGLFGRGRSHRPLTSGGCGSAETARTTPCPASGDTIAPSSGAAATAASFATPPTSPTTTPTAATSSPRRGHPVSELVVCFGDGGKEMITCTGQKRAVVERAPTTTPAPPTFGAIFKPSERIHVDGDGLAAA